VSVVCGDHLISQVYPASVPVEVFLDDIVALLDEELIRRGIPGLNAEAAYELTRVNGTRLDVTKSLDELGIEDGTTLVLTSVQYGNSFEPQYESLSTGLARLGRQLFAPVTEEVAVRTALAIIAVITVTVVGLAGYLRWHSDSVVSALTVGAIGVVLGALSLSIMRWRPKQSDLIDGMAWPAVMLIAEALGISPPGRLCAAHVFIAALACAMLTSGLTIATTRSVVAAATIITVCGIAGVVAAVRMWSPVRVEVLGMCTALATVLLLTMAPTIALWAARIRPPHFGSITGRDLFRRADGLPVDTVSPVEELSDDDASQDQTPLGATISAAAVRANRVLTGICIALSGVMPAAVGAILVPGTPAALPAAVLVGLIVVIFISRGRAFADRCQAVALVCAAAAAVCVGVCRYALSSPTGIASWLCGVGILTIFGSAGLVLALVVPDSRFTPLVRMAAEWFELLAIVAAFPLAAWISGLFTWVRMR
jgi:type VII secretion integral membrane protein EccD